MPAVAVTDHGNVFGAYDFWKQATDAGIKPIIGTEVPHPAPTAETRPACAGAAAAATTCPARVRTRT